MQIEQTADRIILQADHLFSGFPIRNYAFLNGGLFLKTEASEITFIFRKPEI